MSEQKFIETIYTVSEKIKRAPLKTEEKKNYGSLGGWSIS